MENLENTQIRNNIRLKNLNEKVKGENLHDCITDLLESMVGADDGDKIKIESAFRTGPFRKGVSKPRDVIVKFENWTDKKIIMNNFRQHGTVEVEGL